MDKAINTFWALRFLIGVLYVLVNFAQMAGAVPMDPGGQGPGGSTTVTQAIPSTSTLVTLTAPSAYITITNLSTDATLYVSFVSPATTSKAAILPNGGKLEYTGVRLSQFWVIGSAASGNFSTVAH